MVTISVSVLFAVLGTFGDVIRPSTGQGFECEKNADYKTIRISSTERRDMLFYSKPSEGKDTQDCANQCFSREFCRVSVFDSEENKCHFSYHKVKDCADSQPSVPKDSEEVDRFRLVYCINCDGGHRVGSRVKISLPRKSSEQKSTEIVVTNRRRQRPPSRNSEPDSSSSRELTHETCFDELKQMVLVGASFTLERSLTIEECKCLCAESWLSGRYNVQCKSIMYYHERDECVLNHQEKTNQSHPLVELAGEDIVSYYDFTCQRTEKEITNFIVGQCDQFSFPNTQDDATEEPPDNKPSDMCYSKLSEYLLAGAAAAIESDISLQDCKCMCASGKKDETDDLDFSCKSLMYYHNEQNCILNRERRLDRPDLMRKDATHFNVSYYGFDCAQDADLISIYVQNHCGKKNETDHDSLKKL